MSKPDNSNDIHPQMEMEIKLKIDKVMNCQNII